MTTFSYLNKSIKEATNQELINWLVAFLNGCDWNNQQDCKDYQEFLDEVPNRDDDFKYNEGCGSQSIFGTVYCYDKYNNPVWLTRGEYDGSEWWDVNRIPDFYGKIQNLN